MLSIIMLLIVFIPRQNLHNFKEPFFPPYLYALLVNTLFLTCQPRSRQPPTKQLWSKFAVNSLLIDLKLNLSF
jgi:hypothetical protein